MEKEEEAQTKTLGFYYISLQRAQKYKEASAPEGGAGGRACPEQPDPPTAVPMRTVHRHPQRSAHAGGRASLGTGRGMWNQPFAYIKGAPQPMASFFQLRGEMGPEKQEPGLWSYGHSPVLMSPCDQKCWVGLG